MYNNIRILSLFCVILFFFSFGESYLVQQQNTFYLDSTSTCINNCGDSNSPYSSFAQAIQDLSKLKHESTTAATTFVLIVEKGEYFGENNKALIIDFSLDIISTGKDETIIDCENIDFGIRATGESNNLYIKGLTIKNCISSRGSAILTSNSITKLEDVAFISNSAREGSAIYSNAKTLMINSCVFFNNAKESIILNNGFGMIINSLFFKNEKDLVCNGGSITTRGSTFGSTCNSGCNIVNEKRENKCQSLPRTDLCNFDRVCDYLWETFDNCPADCPKDLSKSCNGDGKCDSPFENSVFCPSDCNQDKHPGWKFQTIDDTINKPTAAYQISSAYTPIKIEYLELPKIVNFMGKKSSKVSGILSSQFTVVKSGTYYFNLNLKGLGAIMFIDGQVFFDVFINENLQTMSLERSILLSSDHHHTIEIYFTAVNDLQRDLELKYKFNEDGEYTLVPSAFITIDKEIKCGDGICNEHPSTCLRDCYDSIEEECPAQSPPADLQSYYGPIKDTLGKLLNNQFIFSLPGISYMSHGMDIRTGEILPSPLFSITYCDNSSFSLVHSPHRGLVYSLPPGLFAQISPKCTMDTTTKTYSSSSQMSQDESLDMGLDVSASGSGGGFFAKISVSASLSLSESTKKASETESKQDGSVSKTQLKCEVSKVHMVEPYKFSGKFIQDISKAYRPADTNVGRSEEQETKEEIKKVILKYGSIFYKSATLGGKLEQISVVANSFASSKSSSEVEKSMDMSFSVAASSKILSVGGSVSMSGSLESKTSQDQQSTFESNSARSTMTVYGGKPGSYGDDSDPNSLSTWAATVDFIPYPIDYQVGYVADILPSDWYISKGLNVKKLWLDAELEMFKDYYKKSKSSRYLDDATIDSLGRNHTIYLVEHDVSTCEFTQFSMKIKTPQDGTYDYSWTTNPKSFGRTLLALEFDDNKGIQSLALSSGKAFSCPLIRLHNLNTGRSYEFSKGATVGNEYSYNNVKMTPNTITLTFEQPVNPQLSGSFLWEIDLIGTTGIVKRTRTGIHTSSNKFTIQNYNDFGDIVGVSMTPIVDHEHEDSFKNNFKFTFKSIIITQACPDADIHSTCIPKKLKYNKNLGFTKSYEAWPRTEGMDKFEIPYSSTPFWIPVSPIGK